LSFNGNLQPSSDAGEDLTTKGDVHGYSTENTRVPIGTDNYVLTADSTNSYGLAWKEAAGGDISNFVTFATDSTWATYTVPTTATVSSTAADAWLDVQTSVSQSWSINGAGNSTYNEFSAGHSALGTAFVGAQIYASQEGTAGHTYRLYYCKTSVGTIGSGWSYLNQNMTPNISPSAGWRETPTFTTAILQAGDQLRMGMNEAKTATTFGTTSTVTGSKIHEGAGGYTCGNDGSSESNGAFGLKLLQTFASSNLSLAAEGCSWQSTSEANANMVLDFGTSQLQSGCALYYNSSSTFVQILIQSSDNGTDWTTQRTINATQLTGDTTNYIRYNVVKARYIRVYVNDGVTARVLSGRCDGYIKDGLENHTHLEISKTSTAINLDGTTP